jgi:hypothetical protein
MRKGRHLRKVEALFAGCGRPGDDACGIVGIDFCDLRQGRTDKLDIACMAGGTVDEKLGSDLPQRRGGDRAYPQFGQSPKNISSW